MRAMILASGLGTRLRPLTYERPKALVDINRRPVIDHVINGLKKAGVDYFVVNSYLYPEYLEAHMAIRHHDIKYHLSAEKKLLGTAGAMIPVRDKLANGPFFVHNADILTDEDLNIIKSFHLENRPAATLLIAQCDSERSDLAFDSRNRVSRFLGISNQYQPESYGRYVGVAVFSPQIFDFIFDEGDGLGDEVIPMMMAGNCDIRVYPISGRWFDVGTHERLNLARKAFI